MEYQYNENITISVQEDINIGEDIGDIQDSLGWCHYSYPDDLLKRFMESEEGEVCKDQEVDPTYHTDLFISFLDWLECEINHPVTISVIAQHKFWVFHDLCHAKGHDVISCEGQVTANLEKARLEEGLELMISETNDEMDNYYKEYIREDFYRRFKTHLNIEFFEEEYNWDKELEELPE